MTTRFPAAIAETLASAITAHSSAASIIRIFFIPIRLLNPIFVQHF